MTVSDGRSVPSKSRGERTTPGGEGRDVAPQSPALLPERIEYDISELPTVTFGSQSVAWWGTLGFMVIEGTTLAICAASYFYLRQNFYTWPPFGTQRPGLVVPLWQLAVMAASVPPMVIAAWAAKRVDLGRMRAALTITAVFKVAILVLRWFEFRALHTQWNSNAYGSIAWVTLGFHTTLLVLDLAEDLGLILILYFGRVRPSLYSDVADDAVYWYFTLATWVPLFAMLYLLPWVA